MATVPETTTPRKTPIAFYGHLHDTWGIFLQADGEVSFRDGQTYRWQPVDLETLTRWAVLNGRVDVTDTVWAGHDLVYEASQTRQPRKTA